MKKLFTLTLVIFLTLNSFAQSPQKMSYQCVVRSASGVLVTNQSVGLRISILQGSPLGTVEYLETYSPNPQTNANGLVTVEIGGGFPIRGAFSTINWASGPYFLKTETDPTGGSNYTIVGTSQFLSVPYALHSYTAQTADYNNLTNKPVISVSTEATLAGNGTVSSPLKIAPQAAIYGQILKWNGSSWSPGTDLTGSSLWSQFGSSIFYNTGTVGIGVSYPGGFLQIAGNSNTGFPQLLLTENEGDYARLSFTNIAETPRNWSIAGRPDPIDANSRLNFWYWNGTTGSDIMSITGSGRVGIGTVTPDANLDVEGTVQIGSSGRIFSEIIEITGTTTWEAYITEIDYPQGYNQSNTRVLSVEIKRDNQIWFTLGSTSFGGDAINCVLYPNKIWISSGDDGAWHGKPFRILLMKVQ